MPEKKKRLDRYLNSIHRTMATIAASLVLFMMGAISCSVLMRYLFHRPVAWIVEVSSYLMLYITFLGTAWVLRKEGHVEIDLLTGHLSPRRRALLKSITSAGGVLVGFILTWKGLGVTIDYFKRGVTVMGILNTPQFLLMAIIPIGGFLLMVEFILRVFHFGREGFKKGHSER